MHFCNMNKLYKNQNWIKLSSLNIHDNNCIYIDDFLDFKGGILKRSKKSPFFSSTEFYIKSTPPPFKSSWALVFNKPTFLRRIRLV